MKGRNSENPYRRNPKKSPGGSGWHRNPKKWENNSKAKITSSGKPRLTSTRARERLKVVGCVKGGCDCSHGWLAGGRG